MLGLFSPPRRSLDYFLIVHVGRSFCFSLLRLMPQPFSAVGFNSISKQLFGFFSILFAKTK